MSGFYPDWDQLYQIPGKCHVNVRIRFFQFQILDRSLISKKKLAQFGISEDDRCELCGEVETLEHRIYDCKYTKN